MLNQYSFIVLIEAFAQTDRNVRLGAAAVSIVFQRFKAFPQTNT